MNNFEDVYALNRDGRQISNLETYRRFISKGDKPLECINDEDAKAIKDVLSEIKGYSLFTINVSSANYVDNQLLVGEIEVLSDGRIYAILSTNSSYSVRDALRDPSFNLSTDFLFIIFSYQIMIIIL